MRTLHYLLFAALALPLTLHTLPVAVPEASPDPAVPAFIKAIPHNFPILLGVFMLIYTLKWGISAYEKNEHLTPAMCAPKLAKLKAGHFIAQTPDGTFRLRRTMDPLYAGCIAGAILAVEEKEGKPLPDIWIRRLHSTVKDFPSELMTVTSLGDSAAGTKLRMSTMDNVVPAGGTPAIVAAHVQVEPWLTWDELLEKIPTKIKVPRAAQLGKSAVWRERKKEFKQKAKVGDDIKLEYMGMEERPVEPEVVGVRKMLV